MDLFEELQQILKTNENYLAEKSNLLIDQLMDDQLFKGLFELAELCSYYVTRVIKKQEMSGIEMNRFGDVVDGMSLADLVSNQKDKEFYVKTLKALQERFDILGKN